MLLYISEPETIDMALLQQLLDGSGYGVIAGDSTFRQNHRPDITALLVKSQTRVGSDILTHFPKLQHVIRAGTGLDNIDVEFCKQHNIAVHNAPGANSESVAEYTVMAMLMALRRVQHITKEKLTNWSRSDLLGRNLSAQTVGIVGYGNIGRMVHAKLTAFDCREVLIYDPMLSPDTTLPPRSRATELDELLQLSSIVTLHVPLLPATKYMINRDRLQSMPDKSILINAARGGLVDEAALIEIAPEKQLTYAADSVEDEPNVRTELLDQPNIILTPHIAGYTHEATEHSLTQAIESFLAAAN